MDINLRDNIVKSLGSSGRFGQALKEWLEEEITKLKDLMAIAVPSVEEVVGKQEAIKILQKLFDFLYEKKIEKKEKTNYE